MKTKLVLRLKNGLNYNIPDSDINSIPLLANVRFIKIYNLDDSGLIKALIINTSEISVIEEIQQ